jgi:hypothetical protein
MKLKTIVGGIFFLGSLFPQPNYLNERLLIKKLEEYSLQKNPKAKILVYYPKKRSRSYIKI